MIERIAPKYTFFIFLSTFIYFLYTKNLPHLDYYVANRGSGPVLSTPFDVYFQYAPGLFGCWLASAIAESKYVKLFFIIYITLAAYWYYAKISNNLI